jgi:membrane protein required for colicin V production
MTWFDYSIIAVIAISALISLARGFVKEAMSLGVWVLAFWVSWSFFRDLAPRLADWIDTPSVQLGVAFAILMVVVLMVGGLITFLVSKLVEHTGLSGSDRLIGMVFGAARGVLLVAALVLLAGLTPFPNDPWWQESILPPYFEELALWLRDLLPQDIAERFRYAVSSGMTESSWG